MIRTNRILAEENAPNTVLTTEILDNGKILAGYDKYTVHTRNLLDGVMITDEFGNIAVKTLSSDRTNKILVTDSAGNLQWIGG